MNAQCHSRQAGIGKRSYIWNCLNASSFEIARRMQIPLPFGIGIAIAIACLHFCIRD